MPRDGHKITPQPQAQPPPAQQQQQHPQPQPPYPVAPTTRPVVAIVAPGVVPTAHSVTYVMAFGPHPRSMECTSCHQPVMTVTKPAIGLLTWLLTGALVFVGCWLGCCLIPCCVPECQDVEHWCPNCNVHLGTYKRL